MIAPLHPAARNLGFYSRELFRYLVSIVASQIALLMSPLLVRKLGYAEFGVLELAVSSAGVLGICFSLGLHQLLGARYFKVENKTKTIAQVAAVYMVLAGPISVVLLSAPVADYLSRAWLASADTMAFRLVVVMAFCSFFRYLMLSLTTLSYRSGLYMSLEVLAASIYVIAILGRYVSGELTVRWVLFAQLLGILPAFLAALFFAVRVRDFFPEFSRALLGMRDKPVFLASMIKASAPFVLVGFVTQINSVSDRFVLLQSGVSKAAIGAYSVSNRLAGVLPALTIYLIGNLYSRELYGRCASANGNGINGIADGLTYASRMAKIVCSGMVLILLVYYAGVAALVEPVYGKPFGSLIGFSGLLVAYGISVATAFFMPILIFAERTITIMLIVALGASANVTLNFILIPRVGALACALSLIASNMLIFSLVIRQSRRLARSPMVIS
jgi:O-antigen/teichoic acid export membrane protein